MLDDKSAAMLPTMPETGNQNEPPTLIRQIGKTIYKVSIHFSKTSKETIADKIARLIKNEVLYSTNDKAAPKLSSDKTTVPDTLTDGKDEPP